MGLASKRSTIPRVTTEKLSSQKVSSLELSISFLASISRRKTFIMSQDNQVFGKEGRDLVSRAVSALKSVRVEDSELFYLFISYFHIYFYFILDLKGQDQCDVTKCDGEVTLVTVT